MLVKLAFVMQRLKNIWKKICHDQQRWGGTIFLFYGGDTAVTKGDIELMGSSSFPPLGKTLGSHVNIEFAASAREK